MGDTVERPGPTKEPPIDGPTRPPKPKDDDDGKDGKDGKVDVHVNVHVHLPPERKDDPIHVSPWDPIDHPDDKNKAKKRKAWRHTQTHTTTKGKTWFVDVIVDDDGNIIRVDVSGANVTKYNVHPTMPLKRLIKTRDAITVVDKNGKTWHYDAENDVLVSPK